MSHKSDRRRTALIAGLCLATSLVGCTPFEPAAAPEETDSAQLSFPLSLPEAAPRWNRAYQHALRDRLKTLAQRDDATSQLDIVRLQPLLDGYYTAALPTDLRRERARALGRAQALADPDDDTAFWYEAVICARIESFAENRCDPDSALAHLQRSDPENAAVWLMMAEAASARGDRAGVDAALSQAAKARRYDIRYGASAIPTMRALERLDLPALDAQALTVLDSSGQLADANLKDARTALAGWAFVLPSPLVFQRSCRAAAADTADTAAQRRTDCIATATLLAGSDTLIGRMFGLALMAELTANTAGGAAWRERMRILHWQSTQISAHPALSRDLERAWREGEVVTLVARLKHAGLDRPPSDWLPENPRARALILSGIPLPDTATGQPET